MQVVYNNKTQSILAVISDIQKPRQYVHIPSEDISVLHLDGHFEGRNIQHYKVENEQVVQRPQNEIYEVQQHGKVLTSEERIQYKKSELINVSKSMLSTHLQNNPLQYIDGKYYSVTADKQNLLNNAISVYQIKVQAGIQTPTLEWNATGEECTEWTIEELSALALAISEYVTPLVKRQQAIEVEIKSCTTVEELDKIVIDYETV